MANIARNTASGSNLIDDLLARYQWNEDQISFGFTKTASDYDSDYGRGETENGYRALSSIQKAAVVDAIESWDELINLQLVHMDDGAEADVRVASSSMPKTAWAYTPGYANEAGDVWFGTSRGYFNRPDDGNYAKLTFMHELGHALGLSHPHDNSLNGAEQAESSTLSGIDICPCCGGSVHQNGEHLSAGTSLTLSEENGYFGAAANTYSSMDAMSYSIMSYSSYVNDGKSGYTNGTWDYAQTPMMRDIAAVQYLYGANYETRSDNTLYSWDASTGEKFINGVGQGTGGGHTVYETIWDGNGQDTYDLSNFTSDLVIDLSPGGWTNFGNSQIADLGRGHEAPGNVANALLFEGNAQSLIENAIGGSGDDAITGNDAQNVLVGGLGDDTISCVGNNNILCGGSLEDELSLLGISSDATLQSHSAHQNGDDGDDLLIGAGGNDIFIAGSGADSIKGNGGTDTLVLDHMLADIEIGASDEDLVCRYEGGEITATDISYLVTQDGIFKILDTGLVDVTAQKDSISMLYTIGLGREADPAGLAYWLRVMQDGSSINDIASSVISSDEFEGYLAKQGINDSNDFVRSLYQNVLGREGDETGINYWVTSLDNGLGRADVLAAFTTSDERQTSINMPAMGQSAEMASVDLIAVSQHEWNDAWV